MPDPSMLDAPRVIDPKAFWQAIGQRAVGAAVVTTAEAEGPAGFFALSATHLSASPPLLMVSIDGRTSALAKVRAARNFAISYLPDDAGDLVDIFSGKTTLQGSDRFQPGRWRILTTGAPVLTSAVGALDCVLEEAIERSGTTIAIGRLVDFTSDPDRLPLISFRGRYRTLAPSG
jgi:flavin reductase (DIM6/NTAB) family NADH-FMN oxidoreductase RutF